MWGLFLLISSLLAVAPLQCCGDPGMDTKTFLTCYRDCGCKGSNFNPCCDQCLQKKQCEKTCSTNCTKVNGKFKCENKLYNQNRIQIIAGDAAATEVDASLLKMAAEKQQPADLIQQLLQILARNRNKEDSNLIFPIPKTLPVLSKERIVIPTIPTFPTETVVVQPPNVKLPVLTKEKIVIPTIPTFPTETVVVQPPDVKLPVLTKERNVIPTIPKFPTETAVVQPPDVKLPVLTAEKVVIPVPTANFDEPVPANDEGMDGGGEPGGSASSGGES